MIDGFDRIGSDPVILEMDVTTAIILVSQVQLATRHPKNIGPARKKAESIMRDMCEMLGNKYADYPELKELLDKGWDPKYDVG
jgi:hypothetical protein